MQMNARPGALAPPRRALRIETNVVPIHTPQHPQSVELIDFWERRSTGGRLLRRTDLPCREAVSLLPSIFILEPLGQDGEDWRLRVVGTLLTRWLDFDPTGMSIRELYHPDHVAHDAERYRAVTSERRLHITQGRLCGVNRDFLDLEIVHLPMEGASPEDILVLGCVSIFED
ncbi:MAG: hypothetical protein C0454_11480 [Parvibaculum sp.]|nr:hypothetical protein [Parvibaculum sp.]